MDAGPDRDATVGSPLILCGTVEGGEGPYVASWTPASALTEANTLTPTFVPPTEGEYVLSLSVSDHKGLSATRSVKISALEHATLGSLKWGVNFAGDGYQLLAAFTKPLDKATAENAANYRTTPQSEVSSAALPGEVVAKVFSKPSSAALSADGLTVTLLFSTGTLPRDTRFDISVNDGILGTDGVAVAEVAGLPAIANSADTKVPTVAGRRWATGKQVSDTEAEKETEIWNDTGIREEIRYNYILEVAFSEMMDPVSAENPAAYRIQEGENRYQPAMASLADDGRTLTLIFQDGPLSANSKLDAGLVTTRDMNGLVLAMETGKSVSSNADDKTAPQIAEDAVRFVEGVTDGGYQLTIDFNEPMDRASLESAANYQLSGTAASKAELDADGRRVTVTFASGVFSTGSKLTIPGNSLKDINGVALAAQTNLAVLPSEDEIISPGVPTLTWLPGNVAQRYQIWAVFPVSMDEATIENVNNWQVTGTDLHPTSVVLSSQTTGDAVAGRTALITFAVNSMSRWDALDVSVNDAILDVNSRPVEQVSLSIAPSDADETQPQIAKTVGSVTLPDGTVLPENTPLVLWCDWSVGQTPGLKQYKVTIHFSEVLDGASATNVENYVLADTHPASATLLEGRIVVLDFPTVATPVSNTDTLQLLTIVRDINGLANTVSAPAGVLDGCDNLAPQVAAVNWVSNPVAYQIAVTFNETMDRNSAEFPAAWTLEDVNGIAQIPTVAGLDLEDPTRLLLTFGVGVFAADTQLTFSGDVRDISGNVLSGGTNDWPQPVRPDPDDFAPLQIVSSEWETDSADGYVVLLQFSEPIDGNNPGLYTLDGVEPESATINDGGCTATLVFPIASSPAVFSRAAKLGSSGVKDLSGDATAADIRGVAVNALDTFGPMPARVMWAIDYGSTPGQDGYQVIVQFSEVLDALSAQQAVNYQMTGTFAKPETAVLDPADGLTVTLTFPASSLNTALSGTGQLDVGAGNAIYDVNGVFGLQSTEDINPNPDDNTVPTVVGATATGPQDGLEIVEVEFNEAMDLTSANLVANYVLDPGNGDLSPVTASLQTNGRTVVLAFDQPVAGLMLRVSVGDSIADVNGNETVEVDVGPM